MIEQKSPRDTTLDRLSTGIEVLDQQLEGGIRPGSIVLLSASPISQSEVLLAALTRPRPTLYLTTQRGVRTTRQSLNWSGADLDGCSLVSIDDSDPMPINQAYEHIERISDGSTLVIDTIDPLETAEPRRLWSFLNGVRTRLEETRSLGVLNAMNGREVPPNRDVTEHFADVVFELKTDTRGEFIENRLYIPKVRGGKPLEEVIKVELTDGVSIDTSREIA